jgi:hypothetical protein
MKRGALALASATRAGLLPKAQTVIEASFPQYGMLRGQRKRYDVGDVK